MGGLGIVYLGPGASPPSPLTELGTIGVCGLDGLLFFLRIIEFLLVFYKLYVTEKNVLHSFSACFSQYLIVGRYVPEKNWFTSSE